MIGVAGVHHVGFTVRSLDVSLAFYRDELGCTVVMEQEKMGGYLATIVGYPDAKVRMAHLQLPNASLIIELFEYIQPNTISANLEPARLGNAHICLLVDDLMTTYARLRRHGVTFISAPVDVDTGVNRGAKCVYARDPDGICVELLQRPDAQLEDAAT